MPDSIGPARKFSHGGTFPNQFHVDVGWPSIHDSSVTNRAGRDPVAIGVNVLIVTRMTAVNVDIRNIQRPRAPALHLGDRFILGWGLGAVVCAAFVYKLGTGYKDTPRRPEGYIPTVHPRTGPCGGAR